MKSFDLNSNSTRVWLGWMVEECAEVIEIVSRRLIRGRRDDKNDDVDAVLFEVFDVMGLLSVAVHESVLSSNDVKESYSRWMARRAARGKAHVLPSVSKYVEAMPCDDIKPRSLAEGPGLCDFCNSLARWRCHPTTLGTRRQMKACSTHQNNLSFDAPKQLDRWDLPTQKWVSYGEDAYHAQ